MILLISGSLRAGSTNTAVLRAAADAASDAVFYEGMASLPHFNPEDDVDPLPPAVAELRARIDEADALLFSIPEYAGALPGSFKNLLDWCVGGIEINEKPVGWVNVANEGRGRNAHDQLRIVLGYVNAHIVEDACIDGPGGRDDAASRALDALRRAAGAARPTGDA